MNSIEHFFPYLASFLWLFAEYLLEKSKEKETNEIIDKEEARKYLVTSIQVNRKITDIENISTFLKQGSIKNSSARKIKSRSLKPTRRINN
ncbi:MAG: hypothetical protein E7575_01150 [Ruminococcaceae bacterium]|nr:hypothetical protein [Oscillospiraceae bacterium]